MRGSWRLNKDCNILTSLAPPDIAVCRSRSSGLLNRRPGGPASLGHVLIPASSHQLVTKLNRGSRDPLLLGGGFLYHSLSPTLWSPTNWFPVLTELYNSSIAHSISLEWHVWSSSSGNNCHAVHRSLFRCISLWLYHGILPCPIFSAKPAYAISFDYCPLGCVTSGASLWNGMFGRVEGQYTTICVHTVKWSNSSISNNSIQHKSFVCTQFKCQSSIWPISRKLVGGSLIPSAEMQSVYPTTLADWARLICEKNFSNDEMKPSRKTDFLKMKHSDKAYT